MKGPLSRSLLMATAFASAFGPAVGGIKTPQKPQTSPNGRRGNSGVPAARRLKAKQRMRATK